MGKNFQTAKKPTNNAPSEEAIAAFEEGGAGKDNVVSHISTNEQSPKVEEQAAKAEPTKRLSVDLPANTHKRFKIACSATETKMVAEIMQFIEKRTREMEKEAGITHKNT